MNNDIINKIKEDLLKRKEQIEKDLSSFAKKSKEDKNNYISAFPEYGDESDDNAQEVSQYSTNVATERILEKMLKDINDTLQQINKKKYGICKYCGQQIEVKRLLIRPFSSACVKCKTKLQSRK